jgi:formylglycine-generating enzyme required for sulfatase activity
VLEWVHDWSGEYPTGVVYDPWGPATGTARITRGGDFYNPASAARAAYRHPCEPDGEYSNMGFRPVRTLE